MFCLTGARFNMKADLLQPVKAGTTDILDTDGEWVMNQDPDSGEIIREWHSAEPPEDDPDTDVNEAEQNTFPCIARGIIDGGIRVAGTTERWSELYANIDYIRISFPPNVRVTKRDKVTNVRNQEGVVLWRNEEDTQNAPTVFSVVGVTPIPDPWGRLVEWQALLERSEIQ